MLKELALLFVLAVSLGWTKNFSCPPHQTVKHHFSSTRVSVRSWNLLASIVPPNNIQHQPFDIPLDASVRIEAKHTFFEANKKLWERLRIIFKCYEDKNIGTFVEITKNYAMFKIEDDWVYRFCVGSDVYRSSKVSTYLSNNHDLLMFYVCDQSIEYLILLATFQNLDMERKAYVEKETSFYLSNFSLNLQVENLKYIERSVTTPGGCKSFENVCFRELENIADEKTLHEVPVELKREIFSTMSQILFVITLILFPIIFYVTKICIKMKRAQVTDNNEPSVHYSVESSNVIVSQGFLN